MLINITPKKLDKNYQISATFESYGVAYEERFNKMQHFMSKMRRTKDKFLCAVDYAEMKVIHPHDLGLS